LKALEEDARSRNISLNTLVSQLILAHTDWGRFIDKVGAIRSSKEAFRLLLNTSSDEAIIEAARVSGPDTPKSIIITKYGTLSRSTVLNYIRSAAMYGGFAEYTEVENEEKTVITLIHDLGRKGSLFLTNVLESVFGMVNVRYKMSSSEHSVIVEI
jgi:hypothetical protein